MSFWNTVVSFFAAALSLLGLVHANPTLPQTQQDQAVQVTQQTVTPATNNAIATSSSPAQTPATAMKTYSSGNEFGFQFSYPASFTLTEYPVEYDQNGYSTWSVGLSSSVYPLLNVSVIETASPDAITNCDNDTYNDKLSDVPGTPIVKNGITFYVGTTEDQGAGTVDYGSVYAVAHDGNCYEISSDVHSSIQDVSGQTTSAEQAGQSLVDQIASTFQFTTVEPGAGDGLYSAGAPGMSGGSGACQTFAHLKLGDTDSSVGGQQVSALQMDLGVTPAMGVYGPKTQIAYTNECVGGNAQPSSVAGMSEYTDSGFGFSFWYPSSWTVKSIAVPPYLSDEYVGGFVSGSLEVSNGDQNNPEGVEIDEYNSPSMSITDNCTNCVAMLWGNAVKYYFDTGSQTWMEQDGSADLATTSEIGLADVTNNTMGGLHIFAGDQRFNNDTIVPLSANKFLIVSSLDTGNPNRRALVDTIVATDPSVGAWTSTQQQTATIQAEQQAYAGQ